ncbi:MAG TPA: YciI family protein, partial [Tepidisphaeraceae bacterium]|nr:YciI family protein [Tepidisphaeraceae bacterium]
NRAAGRANDMRRHFEYTRTMRAEGRLLFGGPFTDGTGGLLVYRAENIDQARAYMDADPATQDRIFEYDLHPWALNAADLPRGEHP